jgi:hypothetical protein
MDYDWTGARTRRNRHVRNGTILVAMVLLITLLQFWLR